jgi:hypothetical protein
MNSQIIEVEPVKAEFPRKKLQSQRIQNFRDRALVQEELSNKEQMGVSS